MPVTKEEIRVARTANLYDYLQRLHPQEFTKEGHWLRMKSNPSICMKDGCGGFKDYATLETGNSIDFLVRYMHYGFVEAVTGLTKKVSDSSGVGQPNRSFAFPPRSENDIAVRRYLTGRGFPDSLITRLEALGLLYQDVNRNAVFRSSAGDFYESRGTGPGRPFHQCGKNESDCFWVYAPDGSPEKAYICEGAIDAVSLYLLHLRNGSEPANCAYCGIAGVANQRAIEKIQRWCPAVIAVDNDAAGEQCRLRNAVLPAVVPMHKDWNEDLMATHFVCKTYVWEEEHAVQSKHFDSR